MDRAVNMEVTISAPCSKLTVAWKQDWKIQNQSRTKGFFQGIFLDLVLIIFVRAF